MAAILLVRCDPSDTFGVAPQALRGSGAEIEIWEAFEGHPRPSIDEIGGVIVLGSTYNVEHADEQPFIKDVRELTLEAIDAASRTWGSASEPSCWPGHSMQRS